MSVVNPPRLSLYRDFILLQIAAYKCVCFTTLMLKWERPVVHMVRVEGVRGHRVE